jgi:hypothetical protein
MSNEREAEIATFTRLWRWATETWLGAVASAAAIMFVVLAVTAPLAYYMRMPFFAHPPAGAVTVKCEKTPPHACSVSVSPP